MKVHSTNYTNTFIAIAADCPALQGEIPPLKGDDKTIANLQFDLVRNYPYKFTSDEVLFQVFAVRKDLVPEEMEDEKRKFFSKGQPCFRASPLTKRYGWGIHYNAEGKMALVASGTEEYEKLLNDTSLEVRMAMKNKR